MQNYFGDRIEGRGMDIETLSIYKTYCNKTAP